MPTLQDVPQRIRESLGSEKATRTLIDISRRAGLATPNPIPRVLYLIEIKELSVHDFIDTLVEYLGVSVNKAKAIAREIKEQVLEFERASLYEWGVDISFIETGDAPDLDELMRQEPAAIGRTGGAEEAQKVSLKVSEKPAEEQKVQIKTETAKLEEKPTAGTPKEIQQSPAPTPAKPFMLFEAAPVVEASKQRPTKSFSMPFGFFAKRPSPQAPRIQPTPTTTIKAVVEDDGAPQPKADFVPPKDSVQPKKEEVKNIFKADIFGKIKKDAPRVVHYSGSSTPVQWFGKQGDGLPVAKDGVATQPQASQQAPENIPQVKVQTVSVSSGMKSEETIPTPQSFAAGQETQPAFGEAKPASVLRDFGEAKPAFAPASFGGAKKNPFSFPTGQAPQKAGASAGQAAQKKPQPKVGGNTVYLNNH